MFKILPSSFHFLSYYMYFADKTDLGSKIFIKAYDNKVDVVLSTDQSTLLKTIENVDITTECEFLVDLNKFSGIMKARSQNQEVTVIPGLITFGKKSRSEFEIYPNRYPSYLEKIEYELNSEGRVAKLIVDHEVIFKAYEISSLVKPEEELNLVYLNREYLITTDRYTTILCDNDKQYFEEVYGLTPQVLKALKPYFQKDKLADTIEINYLHNENEDKMTIHFLMDGIQVVYLPSYQLNMIDIFTLPSFIEGLEETDYITVDIDELTNALQRINLSSGYDGYLMKYEDTELVIKALDNQSMETVKILENTLRLNNYEFTLSTTHVMNILNSIKKKKMSDNVRLYNGGNHSVLTRFEAEGYNEFKYFRSKV
jgi:hypothetical protein